MERAELMETAYTKHYDEMFKYAYRLTRSWADAEDLVSSALERAGRRSDSFKDRSNMGAWLRIIIHNAFTDRYRADKRRVARLGFVDSLDRKTTSGKHMGSPTDAATYAQQVVDHLQISTEDEALIGMLPETRAALDSLPGEWAEIIRIIVLEGGSYRDAVRELGIPIGTVMSGLHRAKERLKDVLIRIPA